MPAESTALLTDHYELTMLQAALADGTAHRRSVFELFARRLSGGRRYGVVAGIGRVAEALQRFRFDAGQVAWLREQDVIDDVTADWLAGYRFSGDVWTYAEGEPYFPGSPVVVVEGTFAEAVVLETLLLSILNHDAAIATAAARMVTAAGDRPCIEMGSRRTHEESAVAAARAAHVVGFAATSNLEAGRRHGIPTTGTSAHSFTLLHDDERSAFASQVASLGASTTLLVDTYDVRSGVATALEVAGPSLGAVRLDSGDLPTQAAQTREQLDAAGATRTRIIVTSDLDEFAIARLAAAPVDGYGVGTALVTGSGTPTSGFVYKLVAREDADATMQPVAKKSADKQSVGGRKVPVRRHDRSGTATAEVIGIGARPPVEDGDRELLVPLVVGGEPAAAPTLAQVREHHRAAKAALPAEAHRLTKGDPVLPSQLVHSPDVG